MHIELSYEVIPTTWTALPESQRKSPLTEPKEYPHKNGIYLEIEAARALGLRTREVMHQHVSPEELARKVLVLSAAEARHVRESINDCEPCQESKPDRQ